MLAVLDETTPEGRGGIYYVVAAAVVVVDDTTARKAALGSIPAGRPRPFHWHEEGETARLRMIDCLSQVGAVAHVAVHHPTARRGQEAARATGLSAIVSHLIADGVTELRIEQRQPKDDARDRATILTAFETLKKPGAFAYGWHPKAEPTLWLADAICGAVRGWLLQDGTSHYEKLQSAGIVTEPMWLAPPQKQSMRKPRLPS